MRRAVAVMVAGAAALAACSSSSGGGSVEAFCESAEALVTIADPFAGNPDGFDDRLDELRSGINALADDAPSEIRDDAQTSADGTLKIIKALDGVDLTDEDALFEALSAVEIGPEVEAASDRVSDFAMAECGVDLSQ